MGDDQKKEQEVNLVEVTLDLLHRQLDVLDRLWAPAYTIQMPVDPDKEE